MVRVKRGRVARKRRGKRKHLVKGSKGSGSYLIRISYQQAMKALRYAYRGRRLRKRRNRSLSLIRVNASVYLKGLNYSSFSCYLRKKKCLLNRKILAQLAFYDPVSFYTLLKLLFIFISQRFLSCPVKIPIKEKEPRFLPDHTSLVIKTLIYFVVTLELQGKFYPDVPQD
jgi:large subunit ribosomal protein L20